MKLSEIHALIGADITWEYFIHGKIREDKPNHIYVTKIIGVGFGDYDLNLYYQLITRDGELAKSSPLNFEGLDQYEEVLKNEQQMIHKCTLPHVVIDDKLYDSRYGSVRSVSVSDMIIKSCFDDKVIDILRERRRYEHEIRTHRLQRDIDNYKSKFNEYDDILKNANIKFNKVMELNQGEHNAKHEIHS